MVILFPSGMMSNEPIIVIVYYEGTTADLDMLATDPLNYDGFVMELSPGQTSMIFGVKSCNRYKISSCVIYEVPIPHWHP